MKRFLAATLMAGALTIAPANVALAQDTGAEDVAQEATNDQGDTGLLGLIGLLGLAGLLGLRRRDDDRTRYGSERVTTTDRRT